MSTARPRPSFGDLLRHYRLAADLTQEALAEKAGVSVRGIQKLEAGESRPYRETAARLATALELVGEEYSGFVAASQPAPRTGRSHGTILLLPEMTNPKGTVGIRARHPLNWSNSNVPRADETNRVEKHPVLNLPIALTSFVGREREIEQISRLLASHQLITLLGPPGTGKTRLELPGVTCDARDGETATYPPGG